MRHSPSGPRPRRSCPPYSPTIRRLAEKTRASPKIWQDKADFDAKAAAFGKAVADTRDKAKSSADGLKMAITVVGKACDDCHKDYRLSSR